MFATGNAVFSPEDVMVLRDALDEWCLEKRIDIGSTEAQFAATAALGLFKSGHNTSAKLLAALRDNRDQ